MLKKLFITIIIYICLKCSNYLKIEVYIQDSYHITEDDIVIAYYQHDSNFKDRKLLSRNGKVIWLNKEQIKNDFYFSVESFYSETTYDINIYYKRYNNFRIRPTIYLLCYRRK